MCGARGWFVLKKERKSERARCNSENRRGISGPPVLRTRVWKGNGFISSFAFILSPFSLFYHTGTHCTG